MVREAAGGLGAVGFAVGLAAPPLLAATAVGAALGAGAGKLLHHKIADKLGEQAGETIPLGGAGLIVAYSHSEAEKIEPAVTRAVQKTIGEAEGSHVKALKGALADAQQKMAEGQTDRWRCVDRTAADGSDLAARRRSCRPGFRPGRRRRGAAKPTLPAELSGACRAATR